MYDLTACMVTYNTDEEVLGKIISCFQKLKLNFKLFISDNSEKNGLEEFIKKFSDDRIEYIFNNSNNGFGAGHNIVIEKLLKEQKDKGENITKYHLIINPDIVFEEGTVEKIYDYMEQHPEIGQIGPKIKDPDGKVNYSCRLLPTPFNLIFRRFLPFKKLIAKMDYEYEMRKYDGRHAYVYHIAIKRATHGSDSLMESVSFYIIVVAILLFIVTFFAINRFVTRFIMIHVKNMTKSLEMANRQIEMEQEQQKELLAGISHDIRTPLTAIKAYAEGVRDGIAPTEEQQKRYMGIILKRANDLDSMLEELFLITTLNYKKESRPSERIELGQYVRDFVEDHLAPYQTRGLEIKFRIAAESAFINANPQLLQRVLQNVLNNSAKYKMADIGHCVIDVTSDDDYVYCVISDDGPGVPPESLERLMRPFYRVDSSRTNPQEGSGLGLSIIRRIMEIFEGRVVIENVRPHGLRVILEFPKQGEES